MFGILQPKLIGVTAWLEKLSFIILFSLSIIAFDFLVSSAWILNIPSSHCFLFFFLSFSFLLTTLGETSRTTGKQHALSLGTVSEKEAGALQRHIKGMAYSG